MSYYFFIFTVEDANQVQLTDHITNKGQNRGWHWSVFFQSCTQTQSRVPLWLQDMLAFSQVICSFPGATISEICFSIYFLVNDCCYIVKQLLKSFELLAFQYLVSQTVIQLSFYFLQIITSSFPIAGFICCYFHFYLHKLVFLKLCKIVKMTQVLFYFIQPHLIQLSLVNQE